MSWWSDISKRADEIDRDVRRRPGAKRSPDPVIRDEVDAQDEAIAQAVSMGRTLAHGVREAVRLYREDKAAEQERKGGR